METITNEERNFRARQYYHARKAREPEFIKYTNERNRNFVLKKKLEANAPKKKMGRPRKIVLEPQTEAKVKVGRPLKYPNDMY